MIAAGVVVVAAAAGVDVVEADLALRSRRTTEVPEAVPSWA